jgi:hypothetical protein
MNKCWETKLAYIGPWGGYSGIDTSHPVIMVVIPVIPVKKTAEVLPIWGSESFLKMETAAGTMAG